MQLFKNPISGRPFTLARKFISLGLLFTLVFISLLFQKTGVQSIDDVATRSSLHTEAGATSVYANLGSANLSFAVNSGNPNQISSNDNWSGVASVEGYFGQNLTATHGVDPQTVLGTEFASNALPSAGNTQVNANKGNPSAYNAGGVTEFDSGTYLAIGFQGNVQANPYLVFYLNTTGRSNVTIAYEVTDIDGGSNNAVSPLALQYRVGETGLFTNLPAGFIADVTQGPNLAGQTFTKSVTLPAAASNQPKVQVRLITTNAANTSGGSTPDEWIGINNVVISSLAPSAAQADLGGKVMTQDGRGIPRAVVSLFDEYGIQRSAVTNSFGYYRFTGLTAGNSYVVSVSAKQYLFDTQVVTLYDSMAGVNFVELGSMLYVPEETITTTKSPPPDGKEPTRKKRYL